jgi:death-on-curing protein
LVKSFGFTTCSSSRAAAPTESGILRLLDSALAQPRATFGGQDLHPTVLEKAAALCASLVQNHPFLDGNKRVGHAAMATFLMLNGVEIVGSTDDQERLILDLAAGERRREDVLAWLREHTKTLDSDPAV